MGRPGVAKRGSIRIETVQLLGLCCRNARRSWVCLPKRQTRKSKTCEESATPRASTPNMASWSGDQDNEPDSASTPSPQPLSLEGEGLSGAVLRVNECRKRSAGFLSLPREGGPRSALVGEMSYAHIGATVPPQCPSASRRYQPVNRDSIAALRSEACWCRPALSPMRALSAAIRRGASIEREAALALSFQRSASTGFVIQLIGPKARSGPARPLAPLPGSSRSLLPAPYVRFPVLHGPFSSVGGTDRQAPVQSNWHQVRNAGWGMLHAAAWRRSCAFGFSSSPVLHFRWPPDQRLLMLLSISGERSPTRPCTGRSPA